MKKILIVTQKVDQKDSVLGFFHEWINEFAKHCEKVTVICLWKGKNNLPKNVNILSLGKEDGISKFKYIFRLYKYIWRERKNYDVVFVHMNPIYVVLCGPLWKIFGKRISLWYTHKHVDLKLRLAEKLVNNIFSASQASFRLKSNKLNVMGHGIDTDKFSLSVRQKDASMLRIVTVGRIAETKNLKIIFDAIEVLKKNGVPVVFEIIGGPVMDADKKYLLSLKESAKENGIESSVMFLGERTHEQIRERLLLCDVFVNMSYTGSLDKAVLEAMACEIPVITSNEAYREILAPFDLVVGSKDFQALAQKITQFFNNKEEAKKIGQSLREIVIKEHNLSVLIKKLVEKI